MTTISMPGLSPTMEAGTLARWLTTPGALVRQGDVIAEIEADKATMELQIDHDGRIEKLLVAQGDEVAVGAPIATVKADDGGDAAAPVQASSKRTDQDRQTGTNALPPSVRRAIEFSGLNPETIKGTGKAGRLTKEDVLEAARAQATTTAKDSAETVPVDRREVAEHQRSEATPLAARLAIARGLNIRSVTGSGPGGIIVRRDIDELTSGADRSIRVPTEQPLSKRSATAHAPAAPYTAEKLSSMRRTIARRLLESKQNVPHFYLEVDAAINELQNIRAEINNIADREYRLSINDLLIKALAMALIEVPEANVQFAGEELYRFNRVDVSVAVAVPGGLVTPVIRDANVKRPSAIAREMRLLTARAREGILQPDEYEGGTASLSNLGMYGVRKIVPIINAPQAAILGIGAGEKRAQVDGNGRCDGMWITAVGSFDHRAIDGAIGARLMTTFKDLVENPLKLLA